MSNYLPVEMIEEILVRQPAKSLRRFRSCNGAAHHAARAALDSRMSFCFNKDNLPPDLLAVYTCNFQISIVHDIFCCHGFGYHAPTNEYKVVRIRYSEGDEDTLVAEIYSFNNGECRLLTFSPSAPFILRHQNTASVFMNGALHWLVRRRKTPGTI
uniref:F-box associated beta-propeller type 1 domain-containing protein n=1 Tax=Quercus lobata TaxID=97700 RepID=A0A7N2LTG5_QUELO